MIKSKFYNRNALTIHETVIALTLITILFAVVFPAVTVANKSWQSRQETTQSIQNGRVLIDYIHNKLIKAVCITEVSSLDTVKGFIEFRNTSGTTLRFDVGAGNYVHFGEIGSQSELAGPVTRLQFTCYGIDDLTAPITEVEKIRFIKVEAALGDASRYGKDKVFTTSAYLRTNGNAGVSSKVETYDYSNRNPGTDIFAFAGQSRNAQQLPPTSTEPSDGLSSQGYDDIKSDDDTFHSYSVSSNGRYAQMRFVIHIDEYEDDVTQLDAIWYGKGVNEHHSRQDGASLFIWNYRLSHYELLEESADTEAKVTLNGTLTDSVADYIGGTGANTITLCIVSNDKRTHKNCKLFTDYIKLDVTTGSSGGLLP